MRDRHDRRLCLLPHRTLGHNAPRGGLRIHGRLPRSIQLQQGSVSMKVQAFARPSVLFRILLVVATALPFSAVAADDSTKLDAALTAVVRGGSRRRAGAEAHRRQRRSADPDDRPLRGQPRRTPWRWAPSCVRSWATSRRSTSPRRRIAAVAALPEHRVDRGGARRRSQRLDISVPATRADALRTGTPRELDRRHRTRRDRRHRRRRPRLPPSRFPQGRRHDAHPRACGTSARPAPPAARRRATRTAANARRR